MAAGQGGEEITGAARRRDHGQGRRKRAGAAQQHLYGARANLIQNAWKDRQLGQVRQLLDLQAPTGNQPDLRCFEWHYFRRLVQESQVTLAGHADAVTAVAFSPDRRYLASGGLDGVVKVWELPTRLERCSFTAKGGSIAGVALDAKTDRLASVTKDGVVQVWEIRSGTELVSLSKRTAGPNSVAFSPDGKLLAVAGPTGATIHDAQGKEIASFNGHGSAVLAVAFSPDGRRVVSSGVDGTARVWECPSGKELDQVKVTPAVSQLAFIADGRPVMLNAINGSLAIWLPGQGGSIRSWAFPQRTISALSSDGRQLAYLTEAMRPASSIPPPAARSLPCAGRVDPSRASPSAPTALAWPRRAPITPSRSGRPAFSSSICGKCRHTCRRDFCRRLQPRRQGAGFGRG